MKTFNKTLIALGLVAVSGAFLTSCNKTVTPGKIDGDWDVTSGSTDESFVQEDYSRTVTSTFNGSTVTSTITVKDGNDTDTDGSTANMTISYTFDKKTGEYSSSRVETSEDVDSYGFYYVYNDTTDSYEYEGSFERVAARTSTINESGLFTISGDAGDEIEKNSQVVFQMMSMTDNYTEVYTYFDETTGDELNRTEIREAVYNPVTFETDYVRPDADSEGQESITGSSANSIVWNVVELEKDVMTVEWTDEVNYVDGTENDNNYTSTTTTSWTLTAK